MLQVRPVDGRLTSGYGEKRKGGVLHAGWDLAAPAGTPVRSPVDGVVVAVERDNRPPFTGYHPATVVILGADGLFHLLGHLARRGLPADPRVERFSPGVGRTVSAGDVVGELAAIRGPHVHWEVRHDFTMPRAGLRPIHITIPPGLWLGVESKVARPRRPRKGGNDVWLALVILYVLSSQS